MEETASVRTNSNMDKASTPASPEAPSGSAPAYEATENVDEVPARSRRSKKASYALSLQRACTAAINKFQDEIGDQEAGWVTPLVTAPEAISTMAILFKVADQESAANLAVGSLSVKDEVGNQVGELPSKYFHTNLQHCSDVGRLAFLDAQHGMNSIRAASRAIIGEEGSISYIIDLLEDPEDARYNLKPEINAVKKSATKCLDIAKAMAAKFEYWHLLIIHLKQTSLTQRGEVVKQKDITKVQRREAELDRDTFSVEKQAIEGSIKVLKDRLNAAKRHVENAEAKVAQLMGEPMIPEFTVMDEIHAVRRLVPERQYKDPDRGVFQKAYNYAFGKTQEHIDEDAALREAHENREQVRKDQLISRLREERERERQAAINILENAREHEDRVREELDGLHKKLSSSNEQLVAAKTNLLKTRKDLELLSSKEVELKEIMQILQTSIDSLGTLKDQVEKLVDFFKTILAGVSQTVEKDVESFLETISRGIKEGTNTDEIDQVILREASKRRVMATALGLNCKFSEVADISSAYVAVSANYIRPSLSRLEALSNAKGAVYDSKRLEFDDWLNKCLVEIPQMASDTRSNLTKNMKKSMEGLQRRMIEAQASDD